MKPNTKMSIIAGACLAVIVLALITIRPGPLIKLPPALGAVQQNAPPPPSPSPAMRAILEELASLGGKPLETLDAKEARKQPTPADAVQSLLKKKKLSTAPEAVGDVDDRSIQGPGGKIDLRVYRPAGDGPFPVVVYYHGGGWVIADLDTYDATPRALSNAARCIVVSCDYRKGPEHHFPAAHEDAWAAYTWVLQNAASLKGDPARIAVAGESAGGNMAAVVAIMARDAGVRVPVHQLLVYPVAGGDFDTPSYRENADAKPLNRPMMKWFFDHYLRGPADLADWKISLSKAPNLKGLPPATIITAQIDPLRSEGKAYAEALTAAGVSVSYTNVEGVTHEFFGMGAVLDEARQAQKIAAENLRKAFQRTP